MKCPECGIECIHPCWLGPTHQYKGVDTYVCGKIPKNKIYLVDPAFTKIEGSIENLDDENNATSEVKEPKP